MSRFRLGFFCSILTLFCFLSFASAEEASHEGKKVGKITIFEVRGEQTVETPNVSLKLKTKEKESFNSWVFDEDLKALAKAYDRVEPEINQEGNDVRIQLKLWPRLEIKKILFKGHTQYKTTTLRHEFGLSENSFLQRDALTQALHKLRQHYIKHGYFQVKVNYEIVPLEKESHQIKLIVRITEGRSCKIDNLQFVGFSKEEQNEIEAKLFTQTYNPLLSWATGKGIYSEEALEEDHLLILNFFHDKGYADAKVDIKAIDTPKKDGIRIQISVQKGILYHIGKITVDGNKIVPTKEIKSAIGMQPKEVFSPEKLRETIQSIKDIYGKRGYIEAEITYDTLLNEHQPIYDVAFHIEEGESYLIGMIRIFGNTQTNSNVILRESLLVPGEKFDSRRLKATQIRLQNMGYFKNVNVYAVRSRDNFSLGSNFRDIHIEVEEQPTASASASVGMSSLDDVFGILQLTERNFNITGFGHIGKEGLSAMRGGGEYAHIKGTFGKKEQAILLSWMTPFLHDSLWRLGFELSYTRSQLQSKDYMVQTYGGSVFTSYPLTTYWVYGMRYRLRNSDIDIDKHVGLEAKKEEKREGIISAFSSSLSYDNTDNARKAHRGIRSFMEAEFAGIGGRSQFLKLSYVNAIYIPVWAKGTGKLRAEMRFIEPLLSTTASTVPLSERLFLGGDTTVRGYKAYSLGPHFTYVPPPPDPKKKPPLHPKKRHKTDDPKGGVSSTLLSAEYAQVLHSMVDAFVFIDAGFVSEHRFDLKFKEFHGSYGIGLRFDLMHRLPLEGGYCLPINPQHDTFRHYYFSLSGIF